MVLVIGTENCSKCLMTKNILDSRDIDYEYRLLSEFSKQEQDMYMNMAKEAKMMNFPIILQDEIVVTLQEVC